MGAIDNLFGQGDIFLVGRWGTVDHDGSEAAVNAVLHISKLGPWSRWTTTGIAGSSLKRGLDQFHDVNLAGVFARAGGKPAG